MAVSTGSINKNGQEVMGRRQDIDATHPNQKSYHIRCSSCGEHYAANGCDVFQRKCPRCQGGEDAVRL